MGHVEFSMTQQIAQAYNGIEIVTFDLIKFRVLRGS